MSPIQSNPDQFKKLEQSENEGPFTMLNLVKFKKEGGGEIYAEYLKKANKFVKDIGGRLIFSGKPNELLHGSEDWDFILLVEYPSRQAFLKMASDPDYLKVHELREKSLERAVLYAIDPV